jgi:hypothetical protein
LGTFHPILTSGKEPTTHVVEGSTTTRPRDPTFRFERVIYGFTPDRLDRGARPEPVPVEEGVMLVRGAWPKLPPFAVPSIWEH